MIFIHRPYRTVLIITFLVILFVEICAILGGMFDIPVLRELSVIQFFLASFLSGLVGIPKHCEWYCLSNPIVGFLIIGGMILGIVVGLTWIVELLKSSSSKINTGSYFCFYLPAIC